MQKKVILLSFVLLVTVVILSGCIQLTLSSDTPTTQIRYITVTATPTPTVTQTQALLKGTGTLSIKTYPGDVQVFIDGQYRGYIPDCVGYYCNLIMTDITTGSHYVELKKSGYIFESQRFTLHDGEVITIQKDLTHVPPRDT